MPALYKDLKLNKWIVRDSYKNEQWIFNTYPEAQRKANELTFEKMERLKNKER